MDGLGISLAAPTLSMRALLQRVSQASVTIDGAVHSSIGPGLLVLLGIEEADGREDLAAHTAGPNDLLDAERGCRTWAADSLSRRPP